MDVVTYVLARAYTDKAIESGVFNYETAINKPSINGVELSGDKTASDLGLAGRYTYNPVTESVTVMS